MALNYTEIFTDIGKCIKHIDLLGTDAANLATDENEIEEVFEASDQTDKTVNGGLLAAFTALQEGHYGLRESLKSLIELRLQDRVTVVDELNLETDNIDDILRELVRQMVADSETVDASVVSIGSVTPDAINVGDGTVLIGKVLDGVTEPGDDLVTFPELNGVDSEMALAETVTIECVSDSYTDGVDEGSESFRIHGELPGPGGFSDPVGGSGDGPEIDTVIAASLLTNSDMEAFTSNIPDGWTIDAGTAGTHIFQQTPAGANVYRGASSLRFLGTGAQATIGISQAVDVGGLVPLKRYLVTARYKASATDTASQALVIKFTGTGYTAAGGEQINIAGNAWATSWTLVSFYVNLPADLPSDWTLVIQGTGTWNSGKNIYLDDICMAPVVWHGGLHYAIVPGAIPFVRINDRFTSAITNNGAGVFQRYFVRANGVQLPSDNSGSETINDSLAS